MKLVTWNINGIRSFPSVKEDLLSKFNDADIVCFQETKITKDMMDSDISLVEVYNSYFAFSQSKSGYSGVATYCKNSCTPVNARCSLFSVEDDDVCPLFPMERLKELDKEGRVVITQHEVTNTQEDTFLLSIINVYCPRVDPEKEDRVAFKRDFLLALQWQAENFISSGSQVPFSVYLNLCYDRYLLII